MRCNVLIFILVLTSFFSFVNSADANLVLNSNLNSVDVQGRFRFVTESNSLQGFDNNDLEESQSQSNISFLVSEVSSKLLSFDSRPIEEASVILLKYYVDGNQEGNLTLTWSYSNQNYPITFSYYGEDSSRTDLISSFDMSSRNSLAINNFNSTDIYFKLSVSYVAPSSGESGGTPGSPGSGGGTSCTDSSWTIISEGSCQFYTANRGNKLVTSQSNCGTIKEEYRDCCNPSQTSTTWNSCTPSGTRTGVYDVTNSNCQVTNVQVQGNCIFGCVENWQCVWQGCNPTNCVDLNSCGTQDKKPNSLCIVPSAGGGGGGASFNPIKIKDNCEIDLECEAWSRCEVETGFEDIQTVNPLVIGIQKRKCIDRNGCLSAPSFEQQSCSTKIFLETKDRVFCNEKYIDVFLTGTDYLVARIKDERNTPKKTLKVFFSNNGEAKEIQCETKSLQEYYLSWFEKTMISSDFRNYLEFIGEKI